MSFIYLLFARTFNRPFIIQISNPLNGETESELEHKIGECIWWLINLAERTNIDSSEALEKFLSKTENN